MSSIKILQQYWGYSNFRPLQEDIINNVLEHKDTLALLPTGGGKSICYQVPTLVKNGLCLVISPLIALMKDQVEQLHSRLITARAIISGQSTAVVEEILQQASKGEIQFLYVSPERLETKLFKAYLPTLPITLIAVDEAHCISQWGYDFRPPYLRIAALRAYFPMTPILALTASATPLVQEDICKKLAFNKNAHIFRQSFSRPNLHYTVRQPQSKIETLIKMLQKVEGTSIVYVRNRKRTKEIAAALQQQSIKADYYHAGLTTEERSAKQEAWIKNDIRCIVCTNAFGMGIDKPDVRLVVHMDIPDCLENYYQEAGRAGRDGNTAYAVLLYRQEDLKLLDDLPNQKYPSIETIREVYQALANHLQIAAGQGEGLVAPFHLNDFLHHFKLDLKLSVNALKVLEQEGYIYITDGAWQPATVEFIVDRYTIDEWIKINPILENITKTLLRTYGGIFDNAVPIREIHLAHILYVSIGEVQHQLKQLSQAGIINYMPRNETTLLTWLHNRANAATLEINYNNYFERKKQYVERVASMKFFVTDKQLCRSQYIGQYFGDESIKKCGVCDNCKQAIRTHQQQDTKLHTIILQNIPLNGLNIQTLIKKLSQYPEEQFWEAFRLLQQEGRLITKGEIIVKG